MGDAPGRPVAVFDFDGTLTQRDTQNSFLSALVGWPRLARFAARHAGVMLRIIVGDGDERDWAKRLLVRELLNGWSPRELEDVANVVVRRVLAGELRSDACRWLEWHKRQDHEVVIASASFGCYIRPMGESLGVDGVVATNLQVGPDGRTTGQLDGPNVRGQAKALLVQEYLGPTRRVAYAYGDSRGDRFLLEMAANPRLARKPLPPPPD